MKKIVLSVIVFTMTVTSAMAGGILTNTNQSVSFLKNPARDAAIGLDGVYSNPAGVVFMPEGFHVAFNWQYAHQTRTITSTNAAFALGKKNNGLAAKEFEGVADEEDAARDENEVVGLGIVLCAFHSLFFLKYVLLT